MSCCNTGIALLLAGITLILAGIAKTITEHEELQKSSNTHIDIRLLRVEKQLKQFYISSYSNYFIKLFTQLLT